MVGFEWRAKKIVYSVNRWAKWGILDAVGRGIDVREAVATVNVQQRVNISVNITLRWSPTSQRNRTHCVEYEQKTLS